MENTFLILSVILLLVAVEAQLTFQSDEKDYVKRVDDTPHNYAYWEKHCKNIIEGYSPVVISSLTEFKFIRENQHVLMDGHDFFIGGSTNAPGGENIEYFEYKTTSTGARQVYISTFLFNGYSEDYFSQLKCAPESFVAYGVLCARDKLSFQLNTSLYEKVVYPRVEWVAELKAQCSELGNGWAPALINSQAELYFIKESRRGLTDHRSYWLGGTSQATGDIDLSQYNPNSEAYFPVYIYTTQGNETSNEIFRLRATNNINVRRSLRAVLCENDGLYYQTDASDFKKLVSFVKFSYDYWADRCYELGVGWGPAFAADTMELELFKEKQKSSTDNRSFWIGGRGDESIESQEYSEDTHAWLFLTWDDDEDTDIGVVTSPVVRAKSLKTYGILCEDVRVTFVTLSSFYKTLENSSGLSYLDWSTKCAIKP